MTPLSLTCSLSTYSIRNDFKTIDNMANPLEQKLAKGFVF